LREKLAWLQNIDALEAYIRIIMKISIIVPTFNRPKALKLCLLSLAEQSVLPHEVLIADDGSTSDTRDTVMEMQRLLENLFTIKHVWQEDAGFRKPKILNETVRQSTGTYLIFIDGDCMAHKDFVRAHLDRSDPNAILAGRRVDLGPRLTEKVLHNDKILNTVTPELMLDLLMQKSNHMKEAFLIKNRLLRKYLGRDRTKPPTTVFGCNFSLYRNLFLDINGCDEDFLDGSLEDLDLGIRVTNQGKQIKSVKNLALLFHLWHPLTWAVESDKYQHNLKIIKRRTLNKEKFCKNGIKKIN